MPPNQCQCVSDITGIVLLAGTLTAEALDEDRRTVLQVYASDGIEAERVLKAVQQG